MFGGESGLREANGERGLNGCVVAGFPTVVLYK